MPAMQGLNRAGSAWAPGQASDAMVDGLMSPCVVSPGPFNAEQLGLPGPVEMGGQVGRGHQLAVVPASPMPRVERARYPPIVQRQRADRRWRIE